jgi:hypothetical protein
MIGNQTSFANKKNICEKETKKKNRETSVYYNAWDNSYENWIILYFFG